MYQPRDAREDDYRGEKEQRNMPADDFEADEKHEKDYYQVLIYLDNCVDYYYTSFTELVVNSITINYSCGQ